MSLPETATETYEQAIKDDIRTYGIMWGTGTRGSFCLVYLTYCIHRYFAIAATTVFLA